MLRVSFATLLLVLIAHPLLVTGQPPAAERQPGDVVRVRAERDLEIADLRFRLYENVDFALRMRRLRSEIKLAEAEMASLRRTLREYERFSRLENSPLFRTIEHTRLELLATELRFKDLKEERYVLEEFHRDQRRLHDLLIEQARDSLGQADHGAAGLPALRGTHANGEAVADE